MALLLILAAAILSRRLRKGLGFSALFVLVGAGIAYVVAIIIPSPDTANLAISLGALGLVGAIIWVMATVLAWLMKIVMTDVREEFGASWS